MNIKARLTFQFVLLISVLMMIVCITIYYASQKFRRDEFFLRLENKGKNIAQLLFEVDEVNSELLKKIDTKNPINLPDEAITVFDQKEHVIYEKTSTDSSENHQAFLANFKHAGIFKIENNNRQTLGFSTNAGDKKYYIITSALDVYGYSKLRYLRNVLLVTFALSIVILLLLGRIFAGRAFKPVTSMVKQVNEINVHNLNQRLEVGRNKDELGQLASTFNDLLYRIETAFITQKNFIANASHELRTPLTAISGQLEVELMQERGADEYRKTLESILEDMKSLNEIANKLLVLAHASSENPRNQFARIRIDELLWQARNEILKRTPEATIHIRFATDLDDDRYLTVFGGEQLLKTAFINLIDNGCKYSEDKTVEVTVSPSESYCNIEFADHGIGIPSEDLGNIFQPFFRSRHVMHQKGHGIGLSLVERVVSIHNGSIDVKSGKEGTQFHISLPLMLEDS